MFEDRADAGRRLARELETYRGDDLLVLAIPRGGVPVGYEVADALGADLAVVVVRKLPLPEQPEAGFGAVAEDGSITYHEGAARSLPHNTIDRVVAEQRREVERRIAVLRDGRPLPPINGRTVILVDDGIAMGSTMRASIELCRSAGAERVIVGAPVAGRRVIHEIARRVDRIVVLETPQPFRAVAQAYRRWVDVSDDEVLEVLERWRRRNKEPS